MIGRLRSFTNALSASIRARFGRSRNRDAWIHLAAAAGDSPLRGSIASALPSAFFEDLPLPERKRGGHDEERSQRETSHRTP
jgi:hypothetical protein